MTRPSAFAWLAAAMLFVAPALPAQESNRTSEQFLRPGDVIRLEIWREPDMSGNFDVDEAGSVIFPRVGEYQVLSDTPASLQARLLLDYGQYLRDPNIDVTVLRRVRIIGAVNEPGLKMVDPTVSILDALAVAGGATPQGDPNKIRIIRNGQEVAVDISAATVILDSPIQSGDQIFVPDRSWVSRNAGVVAAGITGTVSLIIAVLIR